MRKWRAVHSGHAGSDPENENFERQTVEGDMCTIAPAALSVATPTRRELPLAATCTLMDPTVRMRDTGSHGKQDILFLTSLNARQIVRAFSKRLFIHMVSSLY
ncbi:hypothetical protein MAR_015052 [Mya arenaria]|uniref:Uncharacterized protein n=1 Tax=Mya arenaria TaxID=6604 RepID=A0ABY7FFY3_MYAAR|nr:hypothetical protein MAR_015052 [Mya arenaria]